MRLEYCVEECSGLSARLSQGFLPSASEVKGRHSALLLHCSSDIGFSGEAWDGAVRDILERAAAEAFSMRFSFVTLVCFPACFSCKGSICQRLDAVSWRIVWSRQ
jgi:hypothetical protein